jgi:hypothetical protein
VGDDREYEVGDLVLCRFDYEYLFYPPHNFASKESFYIGIILSQKEDAMFFFHDDVVYEVLCLDGHHRFFVKWEIEILRKAKKS